MRASFVIALAACGSTKDDAAPPAPVTGSAPTVEPTWFEAGGDFGDGLAPVKTQGKWGYIDKHGHYAIAPRYTHATPFVRGFAVVEPTAIIGVRGEPIIAPARLRGVERIFEATIWSGQIDDKTCVFDRTGTCVADVALEANGTFVVVRKGDRQGLVDRDGRMRIPFEHAELTIRDDRAWSRGGDGKWRMLDVDGKPIDEPHDRPPKTRIAGPPLRELSLPHVPHVAYGPRDGMVRVELADKRTGFYSVDGRPLVVE